MITVPLYLLVGQAVLVLAACYVLASAYRRLAEPAKSDHAHGRADADEAAALVDTVLPDLGAMIGPDGSTGPPPRAPGDGDPCVLVYVLPGCETCQSALGQLRSLVPDLDTSPRVHVLSVGAESSVDAYRRFGFPVWRATKNLAEIFELTAYPVFLAVDETGMIRAAGSVHDRAALDGYLAIGSDRPDRRTTQDVTITRQT